MKTFRSRIPTKNFSLAIHFSKSHLHLVTLLCNTVLGLLCYKLSTLIYVLGYSVLAHFLRLLRAPYLTSRPLPTLVVFFLPHSLRSESFFS